MNQGDLLKEGVKQLERFSDTPLFDSEIMLQHLLKCSRFDLILGNEKQICDTVAEQFLSFVERRKTGEPVAYIVKNHPFFEDNFYVDTRVLVPRPETELLVEKSIAVLKSMKKSRVSVLDLCCGSGCIGLSLSRFFSGTLLLADISNDALEVSQINAEKFLKQFHGEILFVQSDLFSVIDQRFDLITVNPPYLSSNDMKSIANTPVACEPELALYGGEHGFELPAKILSEAHKYLEHDGYLIMELGYEGAQFVRNTAWPGIELIDILRDYSGIERHALFRKR